ncbi:Uncharacterised protein [Algoriella xinjiangensis]|uniref:hypothetical protein n=1 Tax=Algoriella xinjiangensis TaxID=684065 RepID=UPI000F63E3AF|nr:hypothetical protein [Algoriella xinjiangensis]VDH16740.1 Uncharacterised protein [Algoriella xinjiangensis]
MRYAILLFFTLIFSCSNNDDESITVDNKTIEVSNSKATYIGNKLGYSNIYEFSSTIDNYTNSEVKLIVKYELRRTDTKEIVAYAESDELTISAKSKKNDRVERQPKGTLYSNVNYELDKATYRIVK